MINAETFKQALTTFVFFWGVVEPTEILKTVPYLFFKFFSQQFNGYTFWHLPGRELLASSVFQSTVQQ